MIPDTGKVRLTENELNQLYETGETTCTLVHPDGRTGRITLSAEKCTPEQLESFKRMVETKRFDRN